MKLIDNNLIENELWLEDINLFIIMEGHYVSDAERAFFETIYQKMLTEYAPCTELLLSEVDNTDNIYLVRVEYDEFIVGKGSNGSKPIHTMCLSKALSINMKKEGFLELDITLLEWLRNIDYSGIRYDRNYINI